MNQPQLLFAFAMLLVIPLELASQVEMYPWGNLRGIRLDGELKRMETQMWLFHTDGDVERTAHYAQHSDYSLEGMVREVRTHLGKGFLNQRVEDLDEDRAVITFSLEASEAMNLDRAEMRMTFPLSRVSILTSKSVSPDSLVPWYGSKDRVALEEFRSEEGLQVAFERLPEDGSLMDLSMKRGGLMLISIEGVHDRFRIVLPEDSMLRVGRVLQNGVPSVVLVWEFISGALNEGERIERQLRVAVSGTTNRKVATVRVDRGLPGRRWEGIGGNFRLQFPATDPQVIDYNLKHLNVRWSRIAMWWRDWDSDENQNPMEDYRTRPLSQRLTAQLELAKRLTDAGLPLIVSAWDPPAWAVLNAPRRPGTYGDMLDPAKLQRQLDGITSFLLMMQERLGIPVSMFSFNEPDIGVEIVQDPETHTTFFKALGLSLRSNGLSTRILLADTSNGTPWSRSFVEHAMGDPEFIAMCAAMGFHTWGGTEPENLAQWSALADQIGIPLLITEGGADSEAHRNPDLFLDPRYQLDQAAMYVRILRHAQPASIMEWQLTADYSLLDGGGTYGREGPLKPTFRFWQLKQLGMAPAGWVHVPAFPDHDSLQVAALADPDGAGVVIQIVNLDGPRQIRLEGLGDLDQWEAVASSQSSGMVPLPVRREGTAWTVDAPAASMLTIRSTPK
jgi:O-glycosyl hydrolase